MQLLPSLMIAAVVFLTVASCRSELPPVERSNPIEDVELSALLANPDKFDGARIRVTGVARIEFEGNSLYIDRDAYLSRTPKTAVWLNVGWPVKDDVLALNGRDVLVEGMFESEDKGHWGAYVGAIIDVSRFAPEP